MGRPHGAHRAPGPAQPGQTVYGHAVALGTRWSVQTAVEWVDAGRRQIRLRTSLPLGITVTNHITYVPLTDERSMCGTGDVLVITRLDRLARSTLLRWPLASSVLL